MKTAFLTAAMLAIALPAAASAGTTASPSLHETHELAWHPNGKTPAATYRPRTAPAPDAALANAPAQAPTTEAPAATLAAR